MTATAEIEPVLEFWFGTCGADGAIDPTRRAMWFKSGAQHDDGIRSRFGALHERASRGALDEWAGTARGRLALIVALDQFSRHIHRDTPAAFAQDPAAQKLAVEGIDRGADRALPPAQHVFFYLPLEHAEDKELQRLCVRCFDGLARTVAPEWRKDYDGFLDYAQRHRDVIEQFRRFPHRNAVLGRASTAAEKQFLKQPGSAF